jgi:predicted RNA methylase
MYKVYLAKLKREHAKPSCVYKIGITASDDALDRLDYSGPNDSDSVLLNEEFNDIKVMNSTYRKYTREEAERIEKTIMDTIKAVKNEEYFHNWWEDKKLSGITEMRVWNYAEVQVAYALIELCKK